MKRSYARQSDEVVELSERIGPMLQGVHPTIVGGALADLTAIWLAGHFSSAGRDETMKLRARMLKLQTEAVEALIEINEDMMREELRRKGML